MKYHFETIKIYATLKGVDRSNALFHRLTPAQQRVKIAWDTIAQLNLQAIQPTTGVYVSRYDSRVLNKIQEEAGAESGYGYDAKKLQQGLIGNKLDDCKVCALGGLFLSAIRVGNEYEGTVAVGSDPDNVYPHLEKYFTVKQLVLIEYAFESDSVCRRMDDVARFRNNMTDEERDVMVGFKNRNPKSSDRLRAIMNNIIHNKGEFVI